jgi:hypothetical protein
VCVCVCVCVNICTKEPSQSVPHGFCTHMAPHITEQGSTPSWRPEGSAPAGSPARMRHLPNAFTTTRTYCDSVGEPGVHRIRTGRPHRKTWGRPGDRVVRERWRRDDQEKARAGGATNLCRLQAACADCACSSILARGVRFHTTSCPRPRGLPGVLHP